MLYANDLFIFCRGNARSLNSLRKFLDKYGCASGQLVNAIKGTFYLGYTYAHRKVYVLRYLGFVWVLFLSLILGYPFFVVS